ncbi:hypothetical protein [Candidatus Nitrosacidococcus tergens]|uniref:Uncharacterized protein n=1 Tax=Candidatus Nitrosacidococcus tergens TaxID=553981 RepID=A0A7G1Q9C7_9GAMM|nr:hypothetical protein [Candidatus Nitrosacidococcus tergens]CAB1275761.1 conserved protein of unknown function [Candidatus Nitrosacidococcus tergens]
MANQFKIYVVNDTSSIKDFYLFLAAPDELAGDSEVYANSNTFIKIKGNSRDQTNSFTIPIQFVFEVGASNRAVALNTRIDSSTPRDIQYGEQWQATYFPPNQGPNLIKSGSTNNPKSVAIRTIPYDKDTDEGDGWFGSQSFGIKTSSGFAGMTWSPDPGETRTLVPKLEFYIATGTFGENVLADWTSVSSDPAIITEDDFSAGNTGEATVVRTKSGGWDVYTGKLRSSALAAKSNQLSHLYQSHLAICRAHEELIKTAGISSDHNLLGEECVECVLESATVDIDDPGNSTLMGNGDNKITGTMTVSKVLGSIGVGALVLVGGSRFSISNILGKTRFAFTYSGPKSITAISALLVAAKYVSICPSKK